MRRSKFCIQHFAFTMRVGALALLTTCCYQPAAAQGLLGVRYIDVSFVAARPSDEPLRLESNWAVGGGLSVNVPLLDRLDLEISTGVFSWDGTAFLPGPTAVNVDSDLFSIGASGIWHLLPGYRVDPFIGTGVGYQSQKLEISRGSNIVRQSSDDAVYLLQAGVEIAIHDHMAIRPSVSTGGTFDDASFESAISDHLFFNADFIWWLNPTWISRVGFGTDFDDTEIQIEYGLARHF